MLEKDLRLQRKNCRLSWLSAKGSPAHKGNFFKHHGGRDAVKRPPLSALRFLHLEGPVMASTWQWGVIPIGRLEA